MKHKYGAWLGITAGNMIKHILLYIYIKRPTYGLHTTQQICTFHLRSKPTVICDFKIHNGGGHPSHLK